MLIKGMSIGILGMGVTGVAVMHFAVSKKAQVHIFDAKFNKGHQHRSLENYDFEGVHVHGDDAFDAPIDILVVSPGIAMTHPFILRMQLKGIEIIGEIEFAARQLQGHHLVEFYGITGTNGKTTVTLMVEFILRNQGKNCLALGNIGKPLVSYIDHFLSSKEPLYVALELSSYQIDTFQHPFLSSAVILNITPDHLDRYLTMERYAASKLALKKRLKSGKKCWIEEECYQEYAITDTQPGYLRYGFSPNADLWTDGFQVFYQQKVEFILPEEYRGKFGHDLQNMMAAYTICKEAGLEAEKFLEGLKGFKKPPHRIEFVDEIKGVRFINDSKGTNIDAVIKALQTTPGRVHLIAGGVDKGHSYSAWAQFFEDKIVSLHLIGQAAQLIQNELGGLAPTTLYSSLEGAVKGAFLMAKKGETVLLSPGCSSYDQFKDYVHRGDVFKNSVNQLQSAIKLERVL